MLGWRGIEASVAERDAFLARAVDCIPRHGDITKAQYEDFCRNFLQACKTSSRIGGVPTATGLLAMKRPDTFVCISKPNMAGLSDALAFPKTTLYLDNYWNRVVESMRISPWYNAPRPTGRYAELWDGRAAMLDAIYFDAQFQPPALFPPRRKPLRAGKFMFPPGMVPPQPLLYAGGGAARRFASDRHFHRVIQAESTWRKYDEKIL